MNLLPRRYAVYRLADQARPQARVSGLALAPFTEAEVDRYFGDEPSLAREFRWFLERGFLGVLMHDGPHWAGYGWMTCRRSPGPPHLPARIGRDCRNWLFYIHTQVPYRGRGVQKAMMASLVASQGRSDPVYGEVLVGNTPSRRAFIALGFQPAGTLLRLQLPVPILGPMQMCWWDRQQNHPPVSSSFREAAS